VSREIVIKVKNLRAYQEVNREWVEIPECDCIGCGLGAFGFEYFQGSIRFVRYSGSGRFSWRKSVSEDGYYVCDFYDVIRATPSWEETNSFRKFLKKLGAPVEALVEHEAETRKDFLKEFERYYWDERLNDPTQTWWFMTDSTEDDEGLDSSVTSVIVWDHTKRGMTPLKIHVWSDTKLDRLERILRDEFNYNWPPVWEVRP